MPLKPRRGAPASRWPYYRGAMEPPDHPVARIGAVRVSPEQALYPNDVIAAFMRAVERVRENVRNGGIQIGGLSLAATSLTEALNWAAATHDFLESPPRHKEDGAVVRYGWRRKLSAEETALLKAFVGARNIAHHQWWVLIAYDVPARERGNETTWIWGQLPDDKGDARRRDERAAYARVLLDRPILDTLDDLVRVFWPHRRWVITAKDLEQPGYGFQPAVTIDAVETGDRESS